MGEDTVVVLTLARQDLIYTVETGYQGPADTGPYLRIKLRAADGW